MVKMDFRILIVKNVIMENNYSWVIFRTYSDVGA